MSGYGIASASGFSSAHGSAPAPAPSYGPIHAFGYYGELAEWAVTPPPVRGRVFESVPEYEYSYALTAALIRISKGAEIVKKGVPKKVKYEHHVGTWACTLVKEIFHETNWAVTPEKRDERSNKKPDYVVECITNFDPQSEEYLSLDIHLAMEFKKVGGLRLEEALSQLTDTMKETLEERDYNSYQVFFVVQVGMKIGFFEYHLDQTNLEEEGIPNYKGCVSLTQGFIKRDGTLIPPVLEPPLSEITPKPSTLFFNTRRLKKDTKNRREAKEYSVPCIFDLVSNRKHIHFLFQHIKANNPRVIM